MSASCIMGCMADFLKFYAILLLTTKIGIVIIPFSTVRRREKGDKPRRYAICRPL